MRLPSRTSHPRVKTTTSTPSLHSRLVFADEVSLSILGSDTAAMEELLAYWVDLQESLEEAIESGTATAETLTLASKVASRTKYITDNVISLYEDVETLNASFSNMRDLFRDLSLEDNPSTKAPAKHDPTKASPHPPYIKSAYEWLLAHLHNPYPSKEVKQAISADTNTSVTYIENWFVDARRKIGWTALSKERFYNKRSLIVEAATRTFRPSSAAHKSNAISALPLTSEDFDSAFHQIEDNAKNLYLDKLYETNLALKVVESVSADLSSPEELESQNPGNFNSTFSPSPSPLSARPSPQLESNHTSSRKRRNSRSPDMDDTWQRSYKRARCTSPQETSCNTPTSISSPSSSLVEIRSTIAEASPRPTPSIPPPSLANQGKRKRQASDEIDIIESPIFSSTRDSSIPISTSAKRKRLSSSVEDALFTPPPIEPPVSSSITPSRPQTHKRRLSDATGDRPSKRPHSVPSAPRLQTVSDPFPMPRSDNSPSEFDLWWSSSITSGQPITLGLPEPVTTEPIALDDATVPLDITWNSGVVIPAVVPPSKEKSWTELLQDGVGGNDSIFTNLLDPKAFEQQFNVDLFSQDLSQNLFGFDSDRNLPITTNFAHNSFQGASLDLSYPPHQLDFTLPQFDNVAPSFSLPNPTQLLQSLYEPVMTPAQHDQVLASNLEDKSDKTAKIQRLREELMRLEAEVV